MSSNAPLDRSGVTAALIAYGLWGIFPLYWVLLDHVPALQIVAHRVFWCALFVVAWLALRQASWLRGIISEPRTVRLLLASSVLISVNWGLYIWAVTHNRVVEASLGYFINPLVSVSLGVLVLGERLTPVQWGAVAIAAAGVLWLALSNGQPPWIALSLAFSFGFYGLIRKLVAVDAVPGLAVESLLLTPFCLAWLVWCHLQGSAVFAQGEYRQDALLIFGGALTALPLIGFAYAAKRIPYSLVGILQYIAPSLQLACGVLLLGEPFGGNQAIGFACIWIALALYTSDSLRRATRRKPAPAVAESVCDTGGGGQKRAGVE